MKKALLLAAFALQMALTMSVQAGINAGSDQSGFKLSGGIISGGFTLTDGMVKYTSASSTAGTITSTRSTIIHDDGTNYVSLYLTGSYNGSTGAITLGTTGNILRVDGGQTLSTVAATESSRIEGTGGFGGAITVTAAKTLTMDLQGTMNQNINNAGTVSLDNDLVFIDGKGFVTAGGTLIGNGYHLTLDNVTHAVAQTWNGVALELAGPVTLNNTITTATTACSILGRGNVLTLGASGVFDIGADLTMNDLRIAGYTTGSITNVANLYLRNTAIMGSAETTNHIFVQSGVVTGDNPDFFGGAVVWGLASVSLLADTTLAGAWTFGNGSVLNGRGHVLNVASGSLTLSGTTTTLNLSDIIVAGLVSGSIASPGRLLLDNATLIDNASNYAMRIAASSDVSTEAAANVSVTNGLLFGGAVTFNNGANIELLTDVALSATWTFSDNSTINCHGHVLDFSSGGISIAAGKTLRLRNAVLKGLGVGTLTLSSSTSTLNLSDATVIMGASLTYTTGKIVIDGPTTIATGAYVLTRSGGSATLQVNAGITLWYDTLGNFDNNNIVGSSGSGKVRPVLLDPNVGTVTYTNTLTDVANSLFLYHVDGAVSGHQVTLDTTAASFTLDGHGRTFFFDRTAAGASGQCLQVVGGNTATITDLVIDGFSAASVTLTDTGTALVYGNLTTLKLGYDEALASTLTINPGTSGSAVLDLHGNNLNMADASALIAIAGTTSTVTIKNGHITNLSGNKITVATGNTLVLENVDITMSGNTTFGTTGHLTIKGHCKVYSDGNSGGGYTLTNSSVGTLTIAAEGWLTFENTVVYSHTGAATNIVFADTNSTLELIGATFSGGAPASASVVLKNGRLRADHTSKVSGIVTLGHATNTLSLDIFPATKIDLNSGTITYANPS